MCSARISGSIFRQTFNHVSKDVAHYFPGHMSRGLERMQRKLKMVDCIIEVHDARIPFSGRNPTFRDSVLVRPHIIVYNKADLAEITNREVIERRLKDQGVSKILYTSCKDDANKAVKQHLLPALLDVLQGADRYNREKEDHFNVLIIGIPNVGKSSIINAMRQVNLGRGGKATPVGAKPGITKSVMERIRVCETPPVYIYDTPGIMTPQVPDMNVAMKLALCATLKDHLVGTQTVADYLLFMLNKLQYFSYVDCYKLDEPVDDILYVLTQIAKQENLVQRLKSNVGGGYIFRPDFTKAAQLFLRDFRECRLGRVNLDKDLLELVTTNKIFNT